MKLSNNNPQVSVGNTKPPTWYLREKIANLALGIILYSPLLVGKSIKKIHWSENIPKETAIFATTHLSDQDVLLVAQDLFRRKKWPKIVSQSTNLEWIVGIIPRMAGLDHFLPIENTLNWATIQWKRERYSLRSRDIANISNSLQNWWDIIIAGHRPTADGEFPRRWGIWAILLAHLTWAPIIPSIVRDGSTWLELVYLAPFTIQPLHPDMQAKLVEWSQWSLKYFPKELLEVIQNDAKRLPQVYVDNK